MPRAAGAFASHVPTLLPVYLDFAVLVNCSALLVFFFLPGNNAIHCSVCILAECADCVLPFEKDVCAH